MVATLLNTVVNEDEQNADLHSRLANFNRARLSPTMPSPYWRKRLRDELTVEELEGEFVERERQQIQSQIACVPTHPDDFIAWFEELKQSGPGQGDSLFPWLGENANFEQIRWFLEQEVAAELGFEDLVALTQIKMPNQAKLGLAQNYWDEMGQGHIVGMHGPMLGRLANAFGIDFTPNTIVWQSLALSNLMIALAVNRRYAYQSIGALGVVELTAPGRAAHLAHALRRLGLEPKARAYFELHATLDVRHSEAWNHEIIHSLVLENSTTAKAIAEGAILRLRAGYQCFNRYRQELMGVENEQF